MTDKQQTTEKTTAPAVVAGSKVESLAVHTPISFEPKMREGSTAETEIKACRKVALIIDNSKLKDSDTVLSLQAESGGISVTLAKGKKRVSVKAYGDPKTVTTGYVSIAGSVEQILTLHKLLGSTVCTIYAIDSSGSHFYPIPLRAIKPSGKLGAKGQHVVFVGKLS